ncbi:hypothetical protein PSTG_04206 [Puccinia striiformis f. sp. tritici PST-78]|uniref:No apical meristem-associated C-terminal domain-containing protein n=1 Tax=Puccinia striiformis f. sp. tritici PST-78 TaxID=1165861 RepID=A0A0L0VTJ9_9BASI|nr:hypothetical protein PSTG_04206 [Puccinia striiformis f. sp. tritici PST-78]
MLKDTPKFQAALQELNVRSQKPKVPKVATTPAASSPSATVVGALSPSVLDVDGDESETVQSVLGGERMEGQKSAKRKRADKQSIAKIVQMQKEMVKISRDRLTTMKRAAKDAADEAVMSKDLSSMDKQSQAYYQKKKDAILAQQEEDEGEEGEEESEEDSN